jgi:hypothetical protein
MGNYGSNPRKWFIDHRWNNPERVRERDELTDAAKEYRANGEVEADFANFQHRHAAQWDWN